jgi:hypothetical protein
MGARVSRAFLCSNPYCASCTASVCLGLLSRGPRVHRPGANRIMDDQTEPKKRGPGRPRKIRPDAAPVAPPPPGTDKPTVFDINDIARELRR